MNLRNRCGNINFKIIILVLAIILISVLVIFLLNSKKQNSHKELPTIAYEYFVVYSLEGKVGVIDKNRSGNY